MSIKSMTGFGRAHGVVGEWSVDVALRTVNHRFLDLNVRLREEHADLEPAIRRAVANRIARGKAEVTVRLRRIQEPAHEITINESLLEGLLSRFAALSAKFPIGGRLEVRDLLTVPQVVHVESTVEALEIGQVEQIAAIASHAAAEVTRMRETEGRLLVADLQERIAFLGERLGRIAQARQDILERLHATLKERLAVLFADTPLDSGRLEQEAVMLADRSDVSEEVTRLDAHLDQFRDLLGRSTEPVGKKLDFLTQEIQREINTIGAKCRDLAVTRDVIDMKSETEKIREQVQNLE
jgi:uncharacterized protein (TIGR00255 family)